MMLAAIAMTITCGGEPWIRSAWDEHGGRLELAARVWDRSNGQQRLWLVGVSHIGDPAFYEAVAEILDEADIVVFESVLPEGATPPGGEDDAARAASTERTAGLLADTAGDASAASWASWVTGEAVDPRIRAMLRPLSRDGWGRPWVIRPPQDDQPGMVVSLGADGRVGGVDHDADIAIAILPEQSTEDGSSLQRVMADSLGLVFQLDHLPYGDPRWVPGDLTIRELHEAFDHRGTGVVELTNLMAGRGLAGGLVHGVFKMLPTVDALFGGRIADTMRIVFIELLSDENAVKAAMDMQGPDFEEVLLDLRNERAMDVALQIADRDGGPDVAIVYGAAHMPGLVELLEAAGGHWEAAGASWHPAITFDQADSVLGEGETAMLRNWAGSLGNVLR